MIEISIHVSKILIFNNTRNNMICEDVKKEVQAGKKILISFEGKLIQYIGRIQRSKSQKVIYDYRDQNISFFERLFKNRLRYYKRINCV